MCRNRFWGVMGAIACAYFGYLAYERVRDADFPWSHDLWSLLTYSVWIALVLGLLSETRCWRERIFFGLVLVNLVAGLALSLWTTAPMSYSRDAREAVLLVWILATAASLMTLSYRKDDAGAK
jgi:ABC-type transport system involved in cytochrome c biogenesis permease subunit